MGGRTLLLLTNIFIVPILVLHGKRSSYCQNRGRYWLLCRFCWIFIHVWESSDINIWGIVADKYGRKPVIVISIVSVIVFNTLFGLSTSFWMAITTRSLLGFFSGLLGPLKAYASEVCRKEHQALGLSLVSTSRGIGLIIGPAIGGYLSQPAEKFPDVFSTQSIFGRFPYFLPCLCISLFAVCALASCFWLPETLHNHSKHKLGDRAVEALEAAADGSDMDALNDKTDGRSFTSNQSLLHNWPLISTIIVYCVFFPS
ncbi:protein ZINC INDUCED FACILITATOR-LIKE 1-like isoform X2 [Iris pallida]|uniref:Protein ZINC INDUCED FACILITATOR-LIKE 1-like isoform X2 n=1 Tax=Iris pallida TaxID=29817 RepID=A0AAX6E0C9_IRIPA|nr:protein ZINC INDUCED FACILITATOR-LIKE 1-like isoform X2 [Iris pallida]